VTRPRIVFATIAAGGGHVATARAMAQGVEVLAPGAYDLPVVDLVHDLGFVAWDARHKAQWRWMLAHPWSARWGQRVIDAVPAVTRAVLRRALDGVASAAADRFRADPPALIVANHGFLAFALARARRRYGLDVPTLVFATEPLDASALWAEPEADRFLAPSRETAADLVRLGVSPERVEVVGYPVQQAFLHPPSQADARAELGLEDRFTCLVSLGGEGVGGRVFEVVETLLAAPMAPQVVVLTGHNQQLANRLRARVEPRLVVRGFSDDMARHLAACDVVVGKAGPASVMEALAVGRPLLATSHAGLNEVELLRWMESRGLGHGVRDTGELSARVASFMADPGQLNAAAIACRKLDLAGMTRRLAERLLAELRHEPRASDVSTSGLP
jgi:UDP-N-acetylglucosamine:LPS N-acetylglucosamine transferase